MAKFDIDGARASGASDAQIADYLASKTGVDVGVMRKDGMPDSQIAEFLVRSMQGPARASAPAVQPSQDAPAQPAEQAQANPSWGQNFINGIRSAGPQIVNGVSNAVNQLAGNNIFSPPMTPRAQQALDARRAGIDAQLRTEADALKKENASLMDTSGGFWGNLAGNAMGSAAVTAPAMFVPGVNTYAGAAAIGGLSGALQPLGNDESRMTNAGLGAAGGVAGKAIGNGLRWVGNALLRPGASSMTPERAANVLRVRSEMPFEPIPMNAAQMTGDKMSARALDAAQSMPILSGARDAANTQTREAVNRAISRHIGEDTTHLTDQVMSNAQNRISAEFQKVAVPSRIVNVDTPDMAQRMIDAWKIHDAPLLKGLQSKEVADLLTQAGDLMINNGGKVTADRVQATISALGARARDMMSSNSPEKTQIGRMLSEVEDGLLDSLQNSLPKNAQKAFMNARREYAILSMLKQNPGIRDAEGNISIKLLDNAVARSNKAAYMAGSNDLASLTKALRGTVGETLPSSGTAERAQMQRLMNGSALTGLGAAGYMSPGLAALPAAALGTAYGAIKNMQSQHVQNALARVAAQGGGAAMRPGVGSVALQNVLARGGTALSLATPQAATIQQLMLDQR